jgi:hypothetical protein
VDSTADQQLQTALKQAQYPEGKIRALLKKYQTTCPLHPNARHRLFDCYYFTKVCQDCNVHESLFTVKDSIHASRNNNFSNQAQMNNNNYNRNNNNNANQSNPNVNNNYNNYNNNTSNQNNNNNNSTCNNIRQNSNTRTVQNPYNRNPSNQAINTPNNNNSNNNRNINMNDTTPCQARRVTQEVDDTEYYGTDNPFAELADIENDIEEDMDNTEMEDNNNDNNEEINNYCPLFLRSILKTCHDKPKLP